MPRLRLLALVFVVLLSAHVPARAAQPAAPTPQAAGPVLTQLKDINTTTVQTDEDTYAPFETVGPYLFFVQRRPDTGAELWRSDGTDAGTTLVKDIYPGPESGLGWYVSSSDRTERMPYVVNNRIFFEAETAEAQEYWVSDGTESGTRSVASLLPTSGWSAPGNAWPGQGMVFFFAYNTANPTVPVLWRTDGTVGGTVRLKGFSSSLNVGVAEFLGVGLTTYVLLSKVGGSVLELWRSGGTAATTTLVRQITNPNSAFGAGWFGKVGPRGLFTIFRLDTATGNRYQTLWSTDGTALGTIALGAALKLRVNTFLDSTHTLVFNRSLYFVANTAAYGAELWKTNGTPAGTQLVKDIAPGSASSSPEQLVKLNNRIIFTARAGQFGREIWGTGGFSYNTRLLWDIFPGVVSSAPLGLTLAGSQVFFVARDSSQPYALWRTDGSSAGTRPLPGIYPALRAQIFQVVAGQVVFEIEEGSDVTLWRSDGTEPGTLPLRSFAWIPDHEPKGYGLLNGTLVFEASAASFGVRLWQTDGSVAGTAPLLDDTSLMHSNPIPIGEVDGALLFWTGPEEGLHELWRSGGTAATTSPLGVFQPQWEDFAGVVLSGTLFFSADDGVHGAELWRSDGTAEGTMLVKDVYQGAPSAWPHNLTVLNGKVVFATGAAQGLRQLWSTDGTPEGTTLVRTFGFNTYQQREDVAAVLNGVLYFVNIDANASSGWELWRSDGTTAGTYLVKDINPGLVGSEIVHLQPLGNRLYFVAYNSGLGLYTSDGTSAGTSLIEEFNTGNGNQFTSMAVVGGLLYFNADGGGGMELWRSDGTAAGTYLLKDLALGLPGSWPGDLTNVNGSLVFSAYDGEVRSLWRSDGTAEGTVLIAASGTANRCEDPVVLLPLAQELLLSCHHPASGRELWVTDGSAAGTALLADLRPGVYGSDPQHARMFGGQVVFSADDGLTGREPWLLTR